MEWHYDSGYYRHHMPIPLCEGCGREVRAREGQKLICSHTVTFHEDGAITPGENLAWCGDCIDEWNEKMA